MGSPVYSYATAEHMQEPFVMLGEMIKGRWGGGDWSDGAYGGFSW